MEVLVFVQYLGFGRFVVYYHEHYSLTLYAICLLHSQNSISISLYFGHELIQEKNVSVSRYGSFKTTFSTDKPFLEKTGTYTVSVFFDDYDPMGDDKMFYYGETTFSYTAEQKQTVTVPEWIKNNVKWWAAGSIDDNAFVSGIEFLISEGVIDVPITQKSVSTTDEIPSWVRTSAEWWTDGEISDSDFVKNYCKF